VAYESAERSKCLPIHDAEVTRVPRFDTATTPAENRTVRLRFFTAMAMLALAAFTLAACGFETPQATPTATLTPAPTVIPLPGGGDVNPSDEIVIYTAAADAGASATSTATSGEKPAPVRTVDVYDLTQGKRVASFGFGTKDDPPVRAVLAGDQVVTATQRAVVMQRLDGSAPRQLYAAPGTGEVLDIDVSADARLLAIIARSETKNPRTAIVRVNYLVSGGRALTLAVGDPRFGDFQGSFATVHWRTGGGTPALVIGGATDESGHTPSSAVVSIDGAIKATRPAGPAWLAPAGDAWAVADDLVCTGSRIAGHHLAVDDIDSGHTIWQTDDSTPLYSPVEWSPDGQTLIYATRPDAASSCDSSVQVPAQFYEVDLESGQVTAVADLAALHQQWYGRALVTASCQSGGPVTGQWQHLQPLCPANAAAATVSVGGADAGKVVDPVPVGLINPPASGKTGTPTAVPSPKPAPSQSAAASA